MKILDRVLTAATPNSVEAAQSMLHKLVVAFDTATAELEAIKATHEAQRLELAAKGDGSLQASADRVEQADRARTELWHAIEEARQRLAHAQRDAAYDEKEIIWGQVEDLLDERDASIKAMEQAALKMCEEMLKVMDLTESIWDLVPEKPSYRPRQFTNGEFLARVQLLLYGFSNGHIGRGANVHNARSLPSIYNAAQDGRRMLMVSRSKKEGAAA